MAFSNSKPTISFSFPIKTEYRTFLRRIGIYGSEYWCAQKRDWWWPFWHNIGYTRAGSGDSCSSENQAIQVCQSHASGEGNGTFLGVYEGN